jgi:predicted nuclease of predicted toxin-antitoxin system
MKVLLDECLPKKLKREVEAGFVQTVPEADGHG